jgi:uncharacterized cupredoxin-like copper-binding protein
MSIMNSLNRAALAVTMLCTAAIPSYAGTTVNVVESGEGGSTMSITVDKPTVPAGDVVFNVTNGAMTEGHEMILVKLKSANQKIPLIASKHRVDESKLKTLGEVADLQPSASGELKAKLLPGDYMLLCNIKGHYEAGMATTLKVVDETASN